MRWIGWASTRRNHRIQHGDRFAHRYLEVFELLRYKARFDARLWADSHFVAVQLGESRLAVADLARVVGNGQPNALVDLAMPVLSHFHRRWLAEAGWTCDLAEEIVRF